MINISQKEFEEKIRELIDGKTSRIKLAKELGTDIRTLNNKIVEEISVNNPELYIEFIKKFPFKQRQRDDIDYEALVIEMIKHRTTTLDAANKYELGVRTIQRKVNKLEKENTYLIAIYKQVKKNNKTGVPVPVDIQEKIDMLVERPVKINEMNDTRKKHLEEIERIFNNRCRYVSKKEAADSMGISIHRIYMSLNDLYRIKIEENHREMDRTFRSALKVDLSETIKPNDVNNIDSNIQRKGVEK